MLVFFSTTDHIGPKEEEWVRVLDDPHVLDGCEDSSS
jgi:hypothetical protein